MKGVSAVIATILMLMIVIALAGMAYMYLIGMFTSRTAKTIDITDAGCIANGGNGSAFYVSIKNLDTSTPVPLNQLSVRIDGVLEAFNTTSNSAVCANAASIPISETVNCDILSGATSTAAGSFHRVRVVGPANSAEEPANC